VRVDQARPYVLVVADGKVVQRAVTLGSRGDALIDGRRESAVEVTGGSADGATLLRGSAGGMREGTAVRIVGGLSPAASNTSAALPNS
jgi:hypothetical protein